MAEVRKVSWYEYTVEYSATPDFVESLAELRRRDGADGIVKMRCEVMDSSKFGNTWSLAFGPGCTIKTVEELDRERLPGGLYMDGLPSSAAFPVEYTTDLPSATTPTT